MLDALRRRNFRITPQRLTVLRILAGSSEHPTAEQIHAQLLEQFPTTSIATVYKTLSLLKEMGEVLELGFPLAGSRYDGRNPYPHPHVFCLRCNAVVEPELNGVTHLEQEAARRSGYRIVSQRVDFYGLCPNCQGETDTGVGSGSESG